MTISDEEAVFTEPLAAAFEILTQIQLNPGDDVLVLGDGKLGNLCAQVLRLTGAKVTALGKARRQARVDQKVRRANDSIERLAAAARSISSSKPPARRRVWSWRSAPCGRAAHWFSKSTIAGKHEVSLAPIVINEINVIGSRCGPFPDALDALAAKRVAVTPLIEKIYSLNDGVDAYRAGSASRG